jgi:hypothetical protein
MGRLVIWDVGSENKTPILVREPAFICSRLPSIENGKEREPTAGPPFGVSNTGEGERVGLPANVAPAMVN